MAGKGLSWGQKSRVQVSSTKERVPGKGSSLKRPGVGWGEDSLFSPQEGGELIIRDTLPHTQVRQQVYRQDSIKGVQGVAQGHFLPSPTPPHLPCTAGTPKRGLRQGTEKVTLAQYNFRRRLSYLVSVPTPPPRPTAGELFRRHTSCGFLSIQQTFPEHPLAAVRPVGDGDSASKREGETQSSRSSRPQGRAWRELGTVVGAQRKPSHLCSKRQGPLPPSPRVALPMWPPLLPSSLALRGLSLSAEGPGPPQPLWLL